MKKIPVIPIDEIAGWMASTDPIDDMSDVIEADEYEDADFCIENNRNDMSPKFKEGDLLACKRLKRSYLMSIDYEHIFLIDCDSGILAGKILQGKDSQHIILSTRRKKKEIKKRDIFSIAIILGVL